MSIELTYNHKPVCPFCMSAEEQAFLLPFEHNGDLDGYCRTCRKPYLATTHREWSYTTRKPDAKPVDLIGNMLRGMLP